MNCFCPSGSQPNELLRSYRSRNGHQPINNETTHGILCVRFWTTLCFFFIVISVIMVVSSFMNSSGFEMAIALAFIASTCLACAIVLGYICNFWRRVRSQKQETYEEMEMETVGDYIRDIFCLPTNARSDQTESEVDTDEAVEIVTCV